jgi:hypothetical protein
MEIGRFGQKGIGLEIRSTYGVLRILSPNFMALTRYPIRPERFSGYLARRIKTGWGKAFNATTRESNRRNALEILQRKSYCSIVTWVGAIEVT